MIIWISGVFFCTSLLYFLIWPILRPRIKRRVNCWFCNSYQWVSYLEANSFTCKKCDQYNGFDEKGDYNKAMVEQRFETFNHKSPCLKAKPSASAGNGLCDSCNQLQAVIMEQLNKFEAVDDKQYEKEYKAYSDRLNEKYPLCFHCQDFATQKLQYTNNQYAPKPARSRAPSLFSVGSTKTGISKASSVFSKPNRTQSLATEPVRFSTAFSESTTSLHRAPSFSGSTTSLHRTPSVFSGSTTSLHRAPSVFSEPLRSPSLFSEPAARPLRRVPKAASVFSAATYKTARANYPVFQEEDDDESPAQLQHDHANRRRKHFFASGPLTIACNLAVLTLSLILFLALFDSSQISIDKRIWALEKHLPLDMVHYLHISADYSAAIGLIATWLFYTGYKDSKTRINLLDLLAFLSWPVFSLFCIFDGERNPDFNLIKMIFAAFLFILSSLIVFIPKKRKHRKRPNTFYSAFSVASTPVSQCSSRFTGSRLNNISGLSSNLSNAQEDCPDLVESWVQQSEEPQVCRTRTKLHDLKLF